MTTPAPPSPNDHELGFDLPAPASVSRSRALLFALGALAVLAGAFAFGYLPRRAERAALVDGALIGGEAVMRVEVVAPKEGSSDRAISLPGSVQPLEETVIYARASGYVRKWYVDIGDKVKDGQLLAELDTPELDQELDQARAQLNQAQASLLQSQANRELSKANLQRYKQLAPSGVVSMAELDQRQAMAQVDEASVTVAQATIAAQQANIRRLTQLKSFARVTAPFGGTVTQRTIETGSLVTAGNGQPMYKVAAMDPGAHLRPGPARRGAGRARGCLGHGGSPRIPGPHLHGHGVARRGRARSGHADHERRRSASRTPTALLIAGMYAQAAFTLPSPHRVFEVPATAVSSDSHGSRVAIVDEASTIKLVPIVIERDTGSTVEVASGLTGTERVVKLASAQFVDGKRVEVTR